MFATGESSRVEAGDQGGCERRSEVFVKIQKKKIGGGGGGEGRVGGGVRVNVEKNSSFCEISKNSRGVRSGGQGGCERRIEVIVKNEKKKSGGGWGQVRLGMGGARGVGFGRGGGGWLVAMLGVGVMWGMGDVN